MGESSCLCNGCGHRIDIGDGHEDVLHVKKEWGYFSTRDLEIHEFNLCESCYERMIQSFVVPVAIHEKTEV